MPTCGAPHLSVWDRQCTSVEYTVNISGFVGCGASKLYWLQAECVKYRLKLTVRIGGLRSATAECRYEIQAIVGNAHQRGCRNTQLCVGQMQDQQDMPMEGHMRDTSGAGSYGTEAVNGPNQGRLCGCSCALRCCNTSPKGCLVG